MIQSAVRNKSERIYGKEKKEGTSVHNLRETRERIIRNDEITGKGFDVTVPSTFCSKNRRLA
jgi:hypothetical protein